MNKSLLFFLIVASVILGGVYYFAAQKQDVDEFEPVVNVPSGSDSQAQSPSDTAALEAELDVAVPPNLDKGFDDIGAEVEGALKDEVAQ